MMKRKQMAILLLVLCMLLSLCACGGKAGGTVSESPAPQNTPQNTPQSTPQNTSQNVPKPTESPEPTEQTDTESSGSAIALPVRGDAQTLSLQKQRCGLYDWEGDSLLVESEFSHVTLWYEDTARYPQLAEALEQTASMVRRSMEDEYDNLCASARNTLPGKAATPETSVSTLDIQVRRADSVVLSLLSDSYSDYGWIEDFRGMHGTTYDTQTGRELKLSDVIKEMDAVPAVLEQELNRHMWAGDDSYTGVVADYFRNTPEDGISWTLDYNGVSFYFADGDLEEPGSGGKTATVSFAEHPQLFVEKYMAVPEAYMAELPLDSSYFTDLDGDGDLEELNVSGWYNTDVGSYTKVGIYADADGCYQYEDCAASGFIPYYVKTAEGGHYLYLFCEHYEGGPVPMFTLRVYDVSGGKITGVGEMNAGPGYIPTDIYRVPTDPEEFYLEDFDAMAQDMMPYAVGVTGMPEPQQALTPPQGDTVTVSSIAELLDAIGPHVGIMIKPGYYNMSEYIERVWAKEGESWNESHPYVQLRKCYDGVEVVIRRVEGLSICGDNESLTEIVVEPRYAQVLNFEECYDLTLSGLTMGHTETGACSGNVLDFHGCRNITLSAMDIYGCGVYGIGCYSGTGELYAYSSTIRDCAYGALKIIDGNGRFEFHNCGLTGSEACDWYEKSPFSELAFYECVFGENETSYYMFLEDIYTEDCVWSENYEYPEYDDDAWFAFEPETMESAVIDKEFLNDSPWWAYAMVNPESGETVMLPYEEVDGTYLTVSLELTGDGSGWFERAGEYSKIHWTLGEDGVVCLAFEDGRNYYASAYTMGGASYVWLLLEMEECLVWLC